MTLPKAENLITAEIGRRVEDKDRETFARLLFTGPLTARLDRIAKLLNQPETKF